MLPQLLAKIKNYKAKVIFLFSKNRLLVILLKFRYKAKANKEIDRAVKRAERRLEQHVPHLKREVSYSQVKLPVYLSSNFLKLQFAGNYIPFQIT